MAKYKTRQIITVALTLVAIAIAIAALVSVARVLFFSNGALNTAQTNSSQQALLDTSADRSVRMTIRGAIIADETYRSYQIQIAPNSRTLTVYKGYVGQVAGSINLGNNIPAYEQFVYALNKANLMKGNELTGENNDLRGVCAAGHIYEFQILQSNKSLKQLWTSSCSAARGSLNANLDQLTKLFIAQIPNAKSLTGDLWQ